MTLRMFCTGASLMFAAWLVPNHYPPWLTAHSEVLAALAMMAITLGGLIAGGKSRIGIPASATFFFALALVPLAQVVAGQVYFFGDGWVAAQYLVLTGTAVVASSRATTFIGLQFVVGFATTLLAGAVISSLIAMAQQFEVNAGPLSLYIMQVRPGGRPFANLGQPNQLASLLAMGLVGLFILFERQILSTGLTVFIAVLMTVSLAMTQSRTAVLFFVAVGGLLLFASRRLKLRTRPLSVGALAVLWGAAFAAWPTLIRAQFLPQADSLAARVQPGPRGLIWSQLSDALWRQPWTGYGWNQVSVAQVSVAADYPLTRFVEHSHNLVLDILIWNGIPIGLTIIATAAFWLFRRTGAATNADAFFGLCVIVVLLCHAMVEFPLDYLYFLVPFGLAVGLLETSSGAAVQRTISVHSGRAAIIVMTLVTVFGALDYWRVEGLYRDMRFAIARIGAPREEGPPDPFFTQFTQLAALHRFALSSPRTGMSAQELESMRQTVHRYPYAPSLYRYALAQGMNGEIAGAAITLRQLKQIHGDAPYANAQRELSQLAAGQYPELRQLLSQKVD